MTPSSSDPTMTGAMTMACKPVGGGQGPFGRGQFDVGEIVDDDRVPDAEELEGGAEGGR